MILKLVVCAVLAVIWWYLLRVMDRAELNFWHFVLGSGGLFLFLIVLIQPVLTKPLAQVVAAVAGLFGSATHTFAAYFRYGVLFIQAAGGAMTLQIDFECSGIIEIIAYLSLLAFFRVYTRNQRVILAVLGTAGIILANVLRIVVICEIIYFGGPNAYYVSHSLVGRFIFYGLSVLLYFFVFTKPQIVSMKVGSFKYGDGGNSK